MSNKRSLSKPCPIKQDMPPESRKIEALLLKERWKLIQTGVPRSAIRLKNKCLFVEGKVHGRIFNSEFQFSQSVTVPSPSEVVQNSVSSVNHMSNTIDQSVHAHKSTSNVVVGENSSWSASPSFSPLGLSSSLPSHHPPNPNPSSADPTNSSTSSP